MFYRLLIVAAFGLASSIVVITTPITHAQPDTTSTCDGLTMPPITGEIIAKALDHEDLERSYLLYIPTSYDPTQPVPLVMSFHGFGSQPTFHAQSARWEQFAEEAGFIAVYPAGSGFPPRWNSGARFFAPDGGADDVDFVRSLIADLSVTYCVNANRIYAAGLSNGGGMINRLACEASDVIAAFGGVAGAYTLDTGCEPERPIPIIAFHGTADDIVPYEGQSAGGLILPDINTWAAEWAARNDCALDARPIPMTGDTNGIRYIECSSDVEVVLYTVDDGGHTWPGAPQILEFAGGYITQDIDATATMWEFFMRYPLPDDV